LAVFDEDVGHPHRQVGQVAVQAAIRRDIREQVSHSRFIGSKMLRLKVAEINMGEGRDFDAERIVKGDSVGRHLFAHGDDLGGEVKQLRTEVVDE